MTSILLKTSLRHLLRHPWQVGLAILGVALGVAVVVSIDLANDSARRAFALSTDTIAAILPPGAQLTRPALRTQAIEQMTAAFELNLSALSLLALIVGMFLIYNTITFSVVQRRSLIGTLRCLGVTRGQVFALVLAEALVVGLVGALLGLALGLALGRGLVALVTRTINDLYFT